MSEIHAVLKARIDRWATCQSGGLPTGYKSCWPDRFYVDGLPSGHETVRWKATKVALAHSVEEWPDDVVAVDMAMSQMQRYFTDIGRQVKRCILIEHSLDEPREVRARAARLKLGTYRSRLAAGYAYLGAKLLDG